MSPLLAELLGTAILVILGDGVVANVVLQRTKGHDAGWIVITTGWALAVTIAVYSVGSISGAHLNPAVTIGLATIGTFPWANVPGYIVAQIAGGFVGAIVVWLYTRRHKLPFRTFLDLGAMVSFTGIVTFKNAAEITACAARVRSKPSRSTL